jgi:biotin carboxyl carrier protein
MTIDLTIGDRVRTVSVRPSGAVLHVTLDGHTHVVDARRLGEAALSLLLAAPGGGLPVRSVEATFATRAAGEFDVHIDGLVVGVAVRPSTPRRRQGGAASLRTGAGPQRITSPMPGKIVRLLVAAGDEVKARQGLVVVEAMKMENELRAARDGRVREIAVAEGQSVEAGAVLLVVE